MDYIGRSEIIGLAEKRDSPKISLYMPTYRTGRQVGQNSIRFKNLIKQAEDKLGALGLKKRAIEQTLKHAYELLDNSMFWQQQADGLALFADPKGTEYYRLPVVFSELVVAGGQYHLKPLLSLLTSDGQFYLLSLSKNRVRLFQGSRFSISELDPPRMPESLAAVLKYDDFEKQPQFHTGTQSRPGGKRDAIHFGTGDGDVDEKDHLQRYFRAIDSGLGFTIAGEGYPMMLAGVEYMLALYRQVSKYPLLLDGQLAGSPDRLSASELHQQAWPIAEDHFRKGQRKAIDKCAALLEAQSELASVDLKSIFRASVQGKVDTLFVPVGLHVWGVIDEQENEIQIHDTRGSKDQDMLDAVAWNVLEKSGTVYAVAPEDVPGSSMVCAVFRY